MKETEEINYDRLLFNEIYKYPILSKDEINRMFKEMRTLTGEEKDRIREKIILHNLRLPLYVARKFAYRGIDIKELQSEAYVGLIDAVEKYKYDNKEDANFSTFAIHNIKYILRLYIRNNPGLVRLSAHIQDSINKYNQCKSKLANRLGREPLKKEIADELGVSLRCLHEYERYAQDILYLDERMNKEDVDKPATYLDMLSDDKDEIEELTTRMSLDKLKETLNSGKINERDIEIVKTRYGYYNGSKPLSMQKVADIFGFSSKQSVSKKEKRTIKKLRKVFISSRNRKDFNLEDL